jgi:P-type Ca2+ transporter type 2B
VPGAVLQCKSASIKVRMVTGDNKITAKAIAKECNIYDEGIPDDLQVMEGPAFFEKVGGLYCKNCTKPTPCVCEAKDVKEGVRLMTEFRVIRENLRVLARSRPEDKYLMVTGLRECGDVVAVTGDGTNDAPALKKADVGFAMGIAGTDVAKHACDIILLDDNFSSIVKACMWGRNIYDNIRRFLQFQLSVNVVALITAFIGACILKESPLQPIQLLWVNLIMDSLGSVALATEPPTLDLLKRKPQGRDEYIVSRKMVKHILGISFYQIIVMFTIVFAGEKFIREEDPKYSLYGYQWTHSELEQISKSCKEYTVEEMLPALGGDYSVLPGSEFIKEGMLFNGRRYERNNEAHYKCYYDLFGPSKHMSVIFNVFVYMQVFNMLNARKIHDEVNIMTGITRNWLFLGIWALIAGFQFLIATFFGKVFEVVEGLNGFQWMLSIVLGSGCLFVDVFLKFLPDAICPELGKKPAEEEDHTKKEGMVRKNSSLGPSKRISARIGSNSSR